MKKNLLAFALFALFLTSCSSSSDSSDDTVTDPLVKTMIIDVANPADDDFNLLFTYSGNKLTSVKDSGVLIEKYLYTEDKLTRINFPEEGTYIIIDYVGDQVSQFTEYDPDFETAEKTVVAYSGNTFTRSLYTGDLTSQTTLVSTEVCTVENGNVTQIARTSLGSTYTETFTFDNKNNPFKNISNFDVFRILDLDIKGNLNNPTSDSSTNYSFILTYNTENYPLTDLTYDAFSELKESYTYTYY